LLDAAKNQTSDPESTAVRTGNFQRFIPDLVAVEEAGEVI
jgi:hypothetical protein